MKQEPRAGSDLSGRNTPTPTKRPPLAETPEAVARRLGLGDPESRN